ncbi:tyrosine-type recombinase/integrase [Legionella taurinensis]|nr:site-specific integrase [Legionella taurinensis]STY26541.1 phage integrase-like protein [Legionella taurinensis]
MGKLNPKKIEHEKSNGKERRLPDGDGLFLRIRPSEAKSWLFCYRLGTDRKWLQMTLGSLSDLSLKAARETILELRKLVAKGIDPRNARAAIKAENINAMSMQGLFDVWIDFTKMAKEVSPTWIKRHEDRWRIHLKSVLGNILARDVTRSHLATALDAMTRKGIKEETRKALTTLNLMLDYGLTRHMIEQNPARMLKPKDFAATANRPRDRVLSLTELNRLWQALDLEEKNTSSTLSFVTVAAIKLLILTGARRGEVAGMRWSELDLQAQEWKLPSTRTKNNKAHTVYLSSMAVNILTALKERSLSSLWVFDTGRYQEGGHIHEDTLTGVISRLRGTTKGSKKRKEDNASLADLDHFTIHDIRRSAATAWGEHLKISPHIIEKMLNHQPLNKLEAIYQRAVYSNEQKEGWLAWGDIVQKYIATPNK